MNDPADVAARLAEAGYVATVETFPARRRTDPWLAAYAGLSAVGALLVYPLPLVAAVLGLVAVVLHARDSDGRPILTRRRGRSANVVARAPHARTAALVVVTAMDPVTPPPRGLVIAQQTLMASVPAAGAAGWIAEAGTELPRAVAVAGIAGAAALVLTALPLLRPRAPAPASVEVLAQVAPLLVDSDVWLVVSGAEGIEALLEEHEREVAAAAWLSLHAGGGEVVAVSEEGTWRERRADRLLMGAAEEAGAAVRPLRFVATTAAPLLARRRRALTLLIPSDHDGRTAVLAAAHAALRAERPSPSP